MIMNDLFVIQVPIVEKVIRTIAVYVLVVVLFRLTGKRGMASLNTFDFVVIFLLSNVVQNAVIGNDDSLFGGAVGAVTLVAANAGLNRLVLVSSFARHLLEGRPTIVVTAGEIDAGALRHLGMRSEELDHAVRLQNGDDVSEVQDGRFEPGGQLVLTLKNDEQAASKGDVDALMARLDRLELLLASRP